jgi:hypothetical protein
MENFMALLRLSAPWHIYYKELCALFDEDREVRIVYDTDGQIIDIYVDNQVKADAMTELLPNVKDFGSVHLEINVIPANKTGFRRSKPATFTALFENNPIVNNIFTVDMMTNTMTYIVLERRLFSIIMIILVMQMGFALHFTKISLQEFLKKKKVFISVLI